MRSALIIIGVLAAFSRANGVLDAQEGQAPTPVADPAELAFEQGRWEDAIGEYRAAQDATFYFGFEHEPERYVPSDADAKCQPPMYTVVSADDALDGADRIRRIVKDAQREPEKLRRH